MTPSMFPSPSVGRYATSDPRCSETPIWVFGMREMRNQAPTVHAQSFLYRKRPLLRV
jgi:hypothetical protein